jgi:acetyltransferase-like isoleucine patch superfamily enzyme
MIIQRISHVLRVLGTMPLVGIYRFFAKHIGKKVRIYSPLKIDGLENIYIGDSVTIEYKTWLAAIPCTGASECCLEIGEGSIIGHFNHIYCTKSIKIGKNVLTADKVYISDNLHGYTDITIPIVKQPIIQKESVEIGDGSWLGENVCVIGAKVGKNCVIGSNSVVTHDIPDYCVAVGAPARVIKRYDLERKVWVKI